MVQQVKQALRLRLLGAGDRLPTAKDVVGSAAVKPNTAFKAFREWEPGSWWSGSRAWGR